MELFMNGNVTLCHTRKSGAGAGRLACPDSFPMLPLRTLLLVLIFALLALPAAGQLYTASVSGTVSDAAGVVIAQSQIKLQDEQKGYSFTTNTDSQGRYLF